MAENYSTAAADPYSARWISDALFRDAEALTKALYPSPSSLVPAAPRPLLPPPPAAHPALVPSRSSVGAAAAGGGRISKTTKRKPRASRRRPTTFISVDPTNFRRMVQEVTGVRLEAAGPAEPVLKPETLRAGGGGTPPLLASLPTLDTSAFVLGRGGVAVPGSMNCSLVDSVVEGPAPEFEPLSSFPTLESWGLI